ncbi:nucleotidyltransferase domain-containing protein [Paenibacillus donghaensis]|uniref:nucleotidyltransferase domain-containing protein n=1 Tax=Paenibacillus donghaensis TaxID=414771 RepID=UPI001883D5B7|nr:nucleotidyltransferase domain-containing protein [Paenibacillus donghaensis]MBE9914812.1 nucleotidyltransferase domain-containing protein [Paenibacillus donghaensis]
MKHIIVDKIHEIEREHQVKVLFAVESGSRAWGFPSQDSDYDVRFVYIHRPEWYLSIDEKRDVIEVPINELLDINGWDIRKALKLFRKSNPALMEWLVSDIRYYEAYGFKEELLALRERVFSPQASVHHYLHMARGNFREYLQGEQVKIKKYFYVLRPILACKWVEKYNTNPPILFQDLVRELVTESGLKEAIEDLLRRKIAGEEMNLEKRVDVINEFIVREIDHLTDFAQSTRRDLDDPTEMLDQLFRKYLKTVWNFG